jgi:IclR family acetate operon transcriptional repressor
MSTPVVWDIILLGQMGSDKQNSGHHYNIELVDKLVKLLEALRDDPGGLTLQQLAARTGYVKSSIHRALQSLKHHGYVEQPVPGGPYRLGAKILMLARGLKEGIGLLTHARPYLQELSAAFNESVYLAMLRGGRAIFVEVIETRRRELRLVGPLDAMVSFNATAAGKAIAAFLPEDARAALLSRLEPEKVTSRTRTRRTDILREWQQVARRGYATNDEETIVGAYFLAAPLFDAEGAICGAISIGLPKPRYTAAVGRTMVARLLDAARRLSDTLSVSGYLHDDKQLHELR